MTMPATPLDNKEAIAQLNNTINALVVRFIEPLAQQSVENQRLIRETNAGISELKQSVELLTQSTDDSADEALSDSHRITDNENRFNVLLTEAQEDRKRADEDRAETARRFNEQIAEIRAQGEQIRALLSALANTNRRVDVLEQAG